MTKEQLIDRLNDIEWEDLETAKEDAEALTEGGIRGGTKGGIKGGIKPTLTKRQNELLQMIIEDNRVSIDSAAQKMGINRSAAQKHFEALKDKGVITRKEGKRGGNLSIDK